MRVKVTKTFMNCVELRDYDVQKAINNGEDVTVEYEGKTMTLSPRELEEKVMSKSQLMKSKLGGSDYHLLAYIWNPND